MKEKLKDALQPIYQEMLDNTTINQWYQMIDGEKYEYPCMAPVVGENYPKEPGTGFMFVGRATNEWETGVTQSFDEIYNASLDGLYTYIGKKKSAFFRVAENVFSEYYGDDWLDNVAYSNLYKVARVYKNPTNTECGKQWKYVTRIFKKEIETLSPKFVVIFAGKCWADAFIWYINDEIMPKPLETIIWDEDYGYSLAVYKVGEVYYLISEHPQGKKEDLHAEAVLSVFEKYK